MYVCEYVYAYAYTYTYAYAYAHTYLGRGCKDIDVYIEVVAWHASLGWYAVVASLCMCMIVYVCIRLACEPGLVRRGGKPVGSEAGTVHMYTFMCAHVAAHVHARHARRAHHAHAHT